MIRVKSMMSTAVLTVMDTDTCLVAHSKMVAAEVRHLPVCDINNRVIGIVSSRDLPITARHSKKKRVGEVMSHDVKTVHPEDTAEHAIDLMLSYKIGCVPVVDEDDELVGIVTETDALRMARRAAATFPRDSEPLPVTFERR